MGQTSSKDHPPPPPTSAAVSASFALGAGCYWGTEKYIVKVFQSRFPNSILKARVGFMSPNSTNHVNHITYEEVSHTTNSEFVEVLYITLRNPQKHLEQMLRFFFSFHDSTTINRQGNDIGFQYGSYIFYEDEEQCRIAKRVRDEFNLALIQKRIKEGTFQGDKACTKIVPANTFIQAKREHQQYLKNNPNGYW